MADWHEKNKFKAKKKREYVEAKKPKPFPISMDEIYSVGQTLDKDLRILFYLLYVTAGRVSEVLSLRKRDIWFDNVTRKFYYVRLKTKKNRKKKWREIPLPFDGRYKDSQMIHEIIEYISSSLIADDERIFPYSMKNDNGRKTIYKKINKIRLNLDVVYPDGTTDTINDFPLYNHYLRHCRLTHMVNVYNMDVIRLMRFAGWSDPKPAEIYVNIDAKDLASVMI